MYDKKTFAKTLRFLMKEKKISQRELASQLGITYQAVSTWCSGKNYPECDMLLKIALFFSVSTDYLLTGIKPVNKSAHEELGLSDAAIEQIKSWSYESDKIDKKIIPCVDALLCDGAFFEAYIHSFHRIKNASNIVLCQNEDELKNPKQKLESLRHSFFTEIFYICDFFCKFFSEHTNFDKAQSLYEEIIQTGNGDNTLKL